MTPIKSKKLFSYINPFEDKLPGFNTVLNKEAIKSFLVRGDIYHQDVDDDFDNQYRKIAYLVANSDNLFVKLNIPTNEQDLNAILIEENDNISAFVALAYLNPEYIQADLSGSKKFAKTFFGITSKDDFLFEKEAISINNTSENVEWIINENLLNESWHDKEFIYKILTHENIVDNYKLIPEEFWHDKEFMDKILSKCNRFKKDEEIIFNTLLNHHKYNPVFIDYCLNAYDSFSIFSNHYFKDYQKLKEKNPNDPIVLHLNSHFTKDKLYSWMSNSHSSSIVSSVFPSEILYTKESVLSWFKAKLKTAFYIFNPVFLDDYNNNKPLAWINEQTNEWKLELFSDLVDLFMNKNGSFRHDTNYFDRSLDFLLINSLQSSEELMTMFKEKNFSHQKKELYIHTFFNTQIKHKIPVENTFVDLIINHFPKFFEKLPEKYHTLENFKKILPYHDISSCITLEKIIEFNDRDLNILLSQSGRQDILFSAFTASQLKDEEIIKPMILKNNYYLQKNKTLIKFIESSPSLLKTIINSGNIERFNISKDIFKNNLELSTYLVGIAFNKDIINNNSFYKTTTSLALELANPAVFSNLNCLKEIITLSEGNYLKHAPHLFKNRAFTKMVFELFDEHKIHEVENLPKDVRLVLDSYHIKNNYSKFFNSYQLQNNLNNKLEENTSHKVKKHKI